MAFSEKFINQETANTISYKRANRIYWFWALALIFLFLNVTISQFFGYSFETTWTIFFFFLEILFLVAFLFFTIGFIYLSIKGNVFKSIISPICFGLFSLVLLVAFDIVSIFTVSYIAEDATFEFNFIFYVSIFIPLFIGLLVFAYFAFYKAIHEIVKETSKPSYDDEENEVITKKFFFSKVVDTQKGSSISQSSLNLIRSFSFLSIIFLIVSSVLSIFVDFTFTLDRTPNMVIMGFFFAFLFCFLLASSLFFAFSLSQRLFKSKIYVCLMYFIPMIFIAAICLLSTFVCPSYVFEGTELISISPNPFLLFAVVVFVIAYFILLRQGLYRFIYFNRQIKKEQSTEVVNIAPLNQGEEEYKNEE